MGPICLIGTIYRKSWFRGYRRKGAGRHNLYKNKGGDALKEKSESKQAIRWSKVQIMASSKFAHQRDVLNAVLEDEKEYTIQEAEDLISNYMKGGVE